MTKARQNFDDAAWDKNDEALEESQKQLRLKSTCRQVEAFAEAALGRKSASLVSPIFFGGFNVLYRIHFQKGLFDVLVRLPCPALVQFPEEKIVYEAATMAYLARYTTIPVPKLFYHTSSSDIGPALILQNRQSVRDMSDVLAIPDQDPEETPVLNPNIGDSTLKRLYQKVSVIVLQLFKPAFSRIGSLSQVDNGGYLVAGRPITQNMNSMIQLANIPKVVLPAPQQTYESADSWYTALAEMHMAQLIFQHNDLVRSENDCRNKFVARSLFYYLAKQGRLSIFGFVEDNWSAQSRTKKSTCPAPKGSDDFRLWCDDFRPVNLLVDQEDDIVAAIDWEFTYTAPTQFSLDPPWWLLLEAPEMWSSGIENWADVYGDRLKTWLLTMEDTECAAAEPPTLKLSSYMRESWASGRFWLNYASRKSWAFDAIFWKFLDERLFGTRETTIEEDSYWKARTHILGEEGRKTMEMFVQKKMGEMKERVLIDWDSTTARKLLQETLGVCDSFHM
ncbi:phosphotransferase [Fusarium sporotrichioides]|uniref:Phosphotransferase n=1 Tax=Fusarium sporotrichioides TaxID=5514 RepID=A0A395RUB4_FUSSP|nr:phosphotransferase [Fusarium sporotrichioides]